MRTETLSFQQVQKYEGGGNRISSSRLFEFAKILKFPSRISSRRWRQGSPRGGGRWDGNASDEGNIKLKRETFELVRAYYKIRNDDIRQEIRFMVKALASKG
jgi:hypothetical protein